MMLRRLYESPFVRFAVVGGVATAVNYAVYVVLVRCFDDLWRSEEHTSELQSH